LDNPSWQPEATAARLSRLSADLLTELTALQADSAALSSSLAESRSALTSCQQSLEQAAKQARRDSLTAGLWRVGALSGTAGLIGALIDAGTPRDAAMGAGIGAAIGAAWWIAEHWPPWIN